MFVSETKTGLDRWFRGPHGIDIAIEVGDVVPHLRDIESVIWIVRCGEYREIQQFLGWVMFSGTEYRESLGPLKWKAPHGSELHRLAKIVFHRGDGIEPLLDLLVETIPVFGPLVGRIINGD